MLRGQDINELLLSCEALRSPILLFLNRGGYGDMKYTRRAIAAPRGTDARTGASDSCYIEVVTSFERYIDLKDART